MKRATPIHLNEDERTPLQVFIRRGKANARTLTCARILLKCDEGWSNEDIIGALDISDQTIRNVQQRFLTRGVEAVLTDKRQERRRQALTDGHDHWTMRMLAGKAVELGYVRGLSQETVRQLLKKMH